MNSAETASQSGLKPEVQRIISAGKPAHVAAALPRWPVILLTAVSMLLLWLSFTPVEWAPLAWIALVPICQLLPLPSLNRTGYLWCWAVAFAGSLAMLQWMRLGHPAMYGALVALAAWVGLFIPAFVWLARRMIRGGLPLWLAVPIAWTALEFARAHLLTGFSWYYLGHTQYRWSSLIQISDITGAYGVSFVVALVNGALAEFCPLPALASGQRELAGKTQDADRTHREAHASRSPSALMIAATIVTACCIYGISRRTPADQFPTGPAFALIQSNFTPELKHDPDMPNTRYRLHNALMQRSVLLQPDFIVWPETAFPWPEQSVAEGVSNDQILAQLPPEAIRNFGNEADELAQRFRNNEVQSSLELHAQSVGAALVMGIESMTAEADRLRINNSAAFIRPDLGYIGRYDKIHRVIFGEYIPLRSLFPFLERLTPFGSGFGIEAGMEVKLFEYANVRIAPLICFEDTVPHLVRRMAAQTDAGGSGCDVLVNLTNDAWFRGSSELDQHLITAAFRCVETRTPMVRCVNGGISAFIDGNGTIRDPERIQVLTEPYEGVDPQLTDVPGLRDPTTGSWRRNFSGIIFGQTPLDPRSSLYVRFGDWFAWLCVVIAALAGVSSMVRRQRVVDPRM